MANFQTKKTGSPPNCSNKYNQSVMKINRNIEKHLRKQLELWNPELKQLLPDLPEKTEIVFDNNFLISLTGTGGFAISKSKIALAFDLNFSGDKTKQLLNFKGAYFHESYHLIQKFTGDTAPKDLSAINNAIFEGAATVFEREKASTNPPWGIYEGRETMMGWVKEIKSLPNKYNWGKYKFYDEAGGRRWVMYKVGTFIADEVLRQHPDITIENLATMKPRKILKLSGL